MIETFYPHFPTTGSKETEGIQGTTLFPGRCTEEGTPPAQHLFFVFFAFFVVSNNILSKSSYFVNHTAQGPDAIYGDAAETR